MKKLKSLKLKNLLLTLLVGVLVWLGIAKLLGGSQGGLIPRFGTEDEGPPTGVVRTLSEPQTFSLEQATAIIKQTNDIKVAAPKYPVARRNFTYTSKDTEDMVFPVGARLYLPEGLGSGQKVPTLIFAPGTTGIGDQCAASLEQPAKANWANYESHMLAYASQGIAVAIVDYEGLGDPDRLHHYMVGEMEGRAVLDGAKALYNIPVAKKIADNRKLFLGGYSQGGHAVFWADKIAARYARNLKIQGVVGFGPVTNVAKTLVDVTRGANINWFGPFVAASYNDYYQAGLPITQMILPKWTTDFMTHVNSRCIDQLPSYWGKTPEGVYTPEFIQAMRNSLVSSTFAEFSDLLERNNVGDQTTASAKLIHQGAQDNVVLPTQQTETIAKMCRHSKGPAALRVYEKATHYNTMSQSFTDVLSWMEQVVRGGYVPNDCTS